MPSSLLTSLFFVTLFWQTRVNLFDVHAVYDYLIPFVYLSDLLLLAILVHKFWVTPHWLTNFMATKKIWTTALLTFIALASLTIFFTPHPIGAVYKLTKLILFFVFACWVAVQIRTQQLSVTRIFYLTSIGLVPLILLGLIETILGHSLNFKLIGEWYFSIENPAIAKTSLFGYRLMRPYSTFPHPNVFGGVMAVFSLAWLVKALQQSQTPKTQSSNASTTQSPDPLTATLLIYFSLTTLTLIGLFISFSRSAWLAFVMGGAYLLIFFRQRLRARQIPMNLILIVVAVFSLLSISQLGPVFDWDDLSLTRRLELNRVAFEMWIDHSFLGVGLSQSILFIDHYWNLAHLPRFVQPTHNIFLLILAETGLVGSLLIYILIIQPVLKFWKNLDLCIRLAWIVILVTGLADHYWWTLQAGQLTLFLTLGITLANIDSRPHE